MSCVVLSTFIEFKLLSNLIINIKWSTNHYYWLVIMRFPIALILCFLYLANGCTSPYWEVQHSVVVTNESDTVAALSLSLGSVYS